MAQPQHLRDRVKLMRELGVVVLQDGTLRIELGPVPEAPAAPEVPYATPPEDDDERASCGKRVSVRKDDA